MFEPLSQRHLIEELNHRANKTKLESYSCFSAVVNDDVAVLFKT